MPVFIRCETLQQSHCQRLNGAQSSAVEALVYLLLSIIPLVYIVKTQENPL
jgi:hypothetical protein